MSARAHYEVAIIGAGLSGLAAGIRLAHFGRKVCIFERHNAPGGLNGFYSIAGRKYDVGLHAVTNYIRPGVRGKPLSRILRQLRIDRDEFALYEQKRSRIAFGPRGEISLCFTNDFSVLESEVARAFPSQADGFRRLAHLAGSHAPDDARHDSARAVVRSQVSDPLLEDMILCAPLFYGSASERDMEFGQFALLFQAIFLEGLARPLEGIRVIIRLLLDKYRTAGGERRMKCGVSRILSEGGRARTLVLDSGEEVTADQVLSSIGAPETARLFAPESASEAIPPAGRISFAETVTIYARQPADFGWGDDTIVFFNDSERLDYAVPEGPVDTRSGAVCIPNNFDFGTDPGLPEGAVRVTCLANYDRWAGLPEAEYRAGKARWFAAMQRSARRFLPPVDDSVLDAATVVSDMFTPRTVRRFTGHDNGAIYGAPLKVPDGRTTLANVHLCGTDQGGGGIVGALLSGILMANRQLAGAVD